MNNVEQVYEDVLRPLREGRADLKISPHAQRRLDDRDFSKDLILKHLGEDVKGVLLQPPEPRYRIWVELSEDLDRYTTPKDLIIILGNSQGEKSYNLVTVYPQDTEVRHHD
jgi:hypothetical protein